MRAVSRVFAAFCATVIGLAASLWAQNEEFAPVAPTGGKWLCKASMPYSWALATATSDNVFLNNSVEIDYALQVTATNGTTTVALPISVDKVNANLSPILVPLNGAATTETVSATI